MTPAPGLRAHSLVACLSLALAYSAWSHDPQAPRGEAVVGLDPGSLEALSWRHGDDALRLSAAAAGGDIQLALAAGGPGGTPEIWPASRAARDLFAGLPQLRALRRLPAADDAQRRAWGLDGNAAVLELEGRAGGRPAARTLRVGGGTYGAYDYFVETAAEAVFLVPRDALVALFQASTRLQDRDAVGFAAREVTGIALTVAQAHRELALHEEKGGELAWWTDVASPGQRLEEVDAWLSRLVQLRVVHQLAAAPAGPPRVEVELVAARRAGQAEARRARVALWPAEKDGVPARVSRFAAPVLLHPFAGEAALAGAAEVAEGGAVSGAAAAP